MLKGIPLLLNLIVYSKKTQKKIIYQVTKRAWKIICTESRKVRKVKNKQAKKVEMKKDVAMKRNFYFC